MAAKEKSSSRWSAWLAPILFLLAAVAAAGPASALTCGALETRAWEKTSSHLELRPLESPQLLNLHQQNGGAGYDSALDSPLAAEGAGNEAAQQSKFVKTTASDGRTVYKNMQDIEPGVPSNVNRDLVHPKVLERLDAGATNADLAREGIAPIGRDGLQMNLHHVLGEEAGPMSELTTSAHQKFSDAIHGLIEEGNSFRNNPKLVYQYNQFRKNWWISRAADFVNAL